jgi:hypothetical protein
VADRISPYSQFYSLSLAQIFFWSLCFKIACNLSCCIKVICYISQHTKQRREILFIIQYMYTLRVSVVNDNRSITKGFRLRPEHFTLRLPCYYKVEVKLSGSGGIAPCVLNLEIRWIWVVSFTHLPLYPQGKSPRYPLDRRLSGPKASLNAMEIGQVSAPSGIESRIPRCPAQSLVTILTELYIELLTHVTRGSWCFMGTMSVLCFIRKHN